MYSTSSIGTLYTVRNTMRDPKSMTCLVWIIYMLVYLVFLGIGASFYLTYGNEDLRPVAFDFYTGGDNISIYLLTWGYNITMVIFLP